MDQCPHEVWQPYILCMISSLPGEGGQSLNLFLFHSDNEVPEAPVTADLKNP